jgi:hypothetical protein
MPYIDYLFMTNENNDAMEVHSRQNASSNAVELVCSSYNKMQANKNLTGTGNSRQHQLSCVTS